MSDAAKRIVVFDLRPGSPLEQFTILVPPASPWFVLLPEIQAVEIEPLLPEPASVG